MTRKKVQLCPDVTFDSPEEGGTDPFVVVPMNTHALASPVDTKVYWRVSQNPQGANTPVEKSINAKIKWVIDVYWKLTGSQVSALNGYWNIEVYFEAIGPRDYDFEIVTPGKCLIPYGPNPPNTDRNTRTYHARYIVPVAVVKSDPNGTMYNLYLDLRLSTKSEQPPLQLYGFKLGEVKFYNA